MTKSFRLRRGWADLVRHPMRRDTRRVLHDVTFDVRRGECFGLLGPNGAGKTTLFRIIATCMLPDAGTAAVGGHDVRHDAAAIRGMVSTVAANERSLYWALSASENLRLFASLYGLHGAAARRRGAEVLELVGLPDVGTKQVGRFSSGMRQRLLIARALLSRPQVLLLDEPTRSLDPIAARDFRAFLRSEIAAPQGCTIVMATHSSEEAMQLCDRVAVLDRGRLLAVGAAGDLQREFGDHTYVAWTRTPAHPAFAALADRGVARLGAPEASDDGWSRVRLVVAGDGADAAGALRALVAAGADVARFERTDLDLATLLQRVLDRRPRGA